MKYFFWLFMVLKLVFMNAQVNRGSNDTIFCDTKNTSYMIFGENVNLCDIGYPENYAAQVKDNIVFIKALKEAVGPTTVLIKTDKGIYFSILKYKWDNEMFYYDFKQTRGQKQNVQTEIKTKVGSEEELKSASVNPLISSIVVSQDSMIINKMLDFIKIKDEIFTLGFVSYGLDAALTVIRNDSSDTFLKLVLENKSSIPYKLDFISFQYFQDMKKGFLRKSTKAPIDVFPLGEPSLKQIAPHKTEGLVYVIPAFALSYNGYLAILVRESGGDRVLKIKVSGSLIESSPPLLKKNGN
jgi:hypothetical protein